MARKTTTKDVGDVKASLEQRLRDHGVAKGRNFRLLGEDIESRPTDFISTGVLGIDASIGHPGWPVGRISSVVGESSVGKTTICYSAMAETQARGGTAILIDAEYALEPDHAAAMGVDIDTALITQPDYLEDCFEEIEDAIAYIREEEPNRLVTIVLDSIAGIGTKAEMEGKTTVGAHSRVVGSALRRIAKTIAKQRIAFIIVNQYRSKIDAMAFGPQKTMVAERPLIFFSTVQYEVARVGKDGDDKKNPTGILSRAINKKNKIAPPFREADFRIGFSNPAGVDMVRGFFNYALEQGYITKKGGRYAFKDDEKTFFMKDFASRLDDRRIREIVALTGFTYAPDSRIWKPVPDNYSITEDYELDEAA